MAVSDVVERLSDGTVVIQAHRFEVPNCYRHLKHLLVRYARWDLTQVHLVDERTGEVLCRLFPQDKALNARGVRGLVVVGICYIAFTKFEPPSEF